MTVEQLKYFVVVADTLNFTKAAAQLYVAQPSLSYGINTLEAQLQIKLLKRDRRTVQLTEAGKAFYPLVKEALSLIETAVARMQSLDPIKTMLRIGFLVSLSKRFLPIWVPSFMAEHPDINLHLVQLEMGALHEALTSGEIDIAITRSIDVEDCERISWQVICDDPIFVYAHESNPLSQREALTYADIADSPIVLVSERNSHSWYQYIVNTLKMNGITNPVLFPTPNASTVDALVAGGVGISLRPNSIKYSMLQGMKQIPIKGVEKIAQAVIAWKTGNTNPLIHVFCDFVRHGQQG